LFDEKKSEGQKSRDTVPLSMDFVITVGKCTVGIGEPLTSTGLIHGGKFKEYSTLLI
jgi:hypothetical protein